jgi:translation initiation factor eIF-2B subunit alpha
MSELIDELTQGAAALQKSSFNPVSLTAGADLLLRFVTLQRPSVHQPFATHKRNLVMRAKEFVADSHKCVEKIVEYATGLVKDDTVSVMSTSVASLANVLDRSS